MECYGEAGFSRRKGKKSKIDILSPAQPRELVGEVIFGQAGSIDWQEDAAGENRDGSEEDNEES